jgi:hypothetical protein
MLDPTNIAMHMQTYSAYVGIVSSWVPCINYLSIFLVLCFGMDGMFLACECWVSAPACPPAARMTWVLERVVPPSLAGALTMCLVVLTNVTSAIPPLRLFGWFMALLVVAKQLLLTAWVPLVIALRDISIKTWTARQCAGDGVLEEHRNTRCFVFRPLLAVILRTPALMSQCRWIIFILLLALGGILSVFASHTAVHASGKFTLFDASNNFQKHAEVRDLHFGSQQRGSPNTGLSVDFVFGLLAVDNGDELNPTDRGSLEFDASFDLSDTSVQMWLKTLMADLRRQHWVDSRSTGPTVLERFELFLGNMSSSTLCHPNATSELPLAPEAFRS